MGREGRKGVCCWIRGVSEWGHWNCGRRGGEVVVWLVSYLCLF